MLNRNTLKYSTAILAALMLTGCANIDSIYRHNHISGKGQTEFVDAKQRAIIAAPAHEYQYKLKRDSGGAPIPDGKGGWKYDLDKNGNLQIAAKLRKYKFCSEPAPDAFSVRASSTSGRVSSEEGGNLGAMFGMSTAETGATIERTQVINMLRESMFRTCERYMNGALSEDQMNIQTARDQRVMVGTLAIEQLTGVVKRRPTILSTQATAILSEDGKEIIDKISAAEADVEKYEKEVADATKVKSTTEAEYETLNKKIDGAADDADKFCDGAIKAEADQAAIAAGQALANPTTSTATAEELATCKTKKEAASNAAADLAGKEAKLTEAQNEVAKQKKRLELLRDTVLSVAGQGDGDNGSNALSPAHMAIVAEAVRDITYLAFNDHSELNFACTEILRGRFQSTRVTLSPEDAQIMAACTRLINVEIDNVEGGDAILTRSYGAGDSFLNPASTERIERLRDQASLVPGWRARRLLSTPPVELDALTQELVSNLIGGRDIRTLTDDDAKAILDLMIYSNQDTSRDAYGKWNAALK